MWLRERVSQAKVGENALFRLVHSGFASLPDSRVGETEIPLVDVPDGFEDQILRVLARVLEAIERFMHLVIYPHTAARTGSQTG